MPQYICHVRIGYLAINIDIRGQDKVFRRFVYLPGMLFAHTVIEDMPHHRKGISSGIEWLWQVFTPKPEAQVCVLHEVFRRLHCGCQPQGCTVEQVTVWEKQCLEL